MAARLDERGRRLFAAAEARAAGYGGVSAVTRATGALGLALNAIVHWNAIYMQEALRQISVQGASVDDADLAHLSPIIWRHINFLGQYELSLPESVANGDLRPLRNPNSEWEF
jgi:hypothetical protein